MLTDFATRLTRARNLHASGSEWGRDVVRGARSRASVVEALAAYPAHERCVLAFAYAQAVRECVRMPSKSPSHRAKLAAAQERAMRIRRTVQLDREAEAFRVARTVRER